MSWNEVTRKNIYWYKHKCEFLDHLDAEEERRVQALKMKHGIK